MKQANYIPITAQCRRDLAAQLDKFGKSIGVSRSRCMVAAVRLLMAEYEREKANGYNGRASLCLLLESK